MYRPFYQVSTLFVERTFKFALFVINWISRQMRLVRTHCSRGYSRELPLTSSTVVCAANFLKCLCIGLTAYLYGKKRHRHMSILGDAVASFLERPDETTKDMCLADISSISNIWLARTCPEPQIWHPRKNRWAKGASKQMWGTTMGWWAT